MKHKALFLFLTFLIISLSKTNARTQNKYNFNSDWLLKIGDIPEAGNSAFVDSDWVKVTLPRAFNEDEAFKVHIAQLTDTVMWYRKHFRLPEGSKDKKVFIEFEGIRQSADIYINGKHIGFHENGVMAVGFDLTPYLSPRKGNVIALRIDNNWEYKERATGVKYQWNDRNFNANYGGMPKNVWLHITDKLYQTLPLYSNLKTTGVYVYADNIKVKERKATIHAESQIRNEHSKALHVVYEANVFDRDGTLVKTVKGNEITILPNETKIMKASAEVCGLHFWSWGYGYLYTVKTRLIVNGKVLDEVATKTGFRKTRFAEGKIWLNDRVIQMKGYAQRTSNEWPGVGLSVPPWLSDYSNDLMVKGNANLVRWMHVTPWKQDVESCDRVGLIESMPAGDAEKDSHGEQWRQRTELMRDAIIYNRNNPSILFYECGNESISEEHMAEMKSIRDTYDPHGGRAIGSREMLDSHVAEYGGEMLYINKSARHPMWAMEYSRDEGLRKYWDKYSYPYHKEGAGPLYRGADASDYNHNQDALAVENVRRWYDYWLERPGTGRRVSSGGVKIVFSDTNTHCRGAENYRCSGSVDAMRIPKDAFYANQVMWDGWVDVDVPRTYIIGHWNYQKGTVKPVYVVSNADKVELFVNGKSKGFGKQDHRFLFTFKDVVWVSGKIEAVGYNENNKEVSRDSKLTASTPKKIKLTLIQNPKGFYADGADMVLVQAEVIDGNNMRCPLANNKLKFTLRGPAEWRGGIAQGPDNYILSTTLPVECGINRALIRSKNTAGKITLIAQTEGLISDTLSFASLPVEVSNGLSRFIPGCLLTGRLNRGETPYTLSYIDTKTDIPIFSATAGANQENAVNSFDDNELSEWRNDGHLSTAWITYKLSRIATIDEVCLKLTGWRSRSYPLDIYAGKELIWAGETEKSLGYVHLKVKPAHTDEITIRLKGNATESDAFGQITELAAPQELDLYHAKGGDKTGDELRIVEVEFLEHLNK
ncbi:DUF4982 domain-containing protein [uncultured Bacteroides sp.]|uniref:glycoside hydrolase family 2 protein n=1 Tax=uncultured Bacteroides sp. TaxID=162156 RepID=UPI002AA936AA|nr:DUF4982 domain-containing protein [uncultured Bacteroides sp.]